VLIESHYPPTIRVSYGRIYTANLPEGSVGYGGRRRDGERAACSICLAPQFLEGQGIKGPRRWDSGRGPLQAAAEDRGIEFFGENVYCGNRVEIDFIVASVKLNVFDRQLGNVLRLRKVSSGMA